MTAHAELPPSSKVGPVWLAVVEVPATERVRCQASGCNHLVYRRIHMVREAGSVRVYGSECCNKIFGQALTDSTKRYTTGDGRSLTDNERRLLVENTERLIRQFEDEHQQVLVQRAAEQLQQKPLPAARPAPIIGPGFSAIDKLEARRVMKEKWQISENLIDSPGWKLLLWKETQNACLAREEAQRLSREGATDRTDENRGD